MSAPLELRLTLQDMPLPEILLAILFGSVLLGCAVTDARTYRIPDYFSAILFSGGILASALGWWPVSFGAAVAAFLFIQPLLFLMWWGRALPVPIPSPSEVSGTPEAEVITESENLASTAEVVQSPELVSGPLAVASDIAWTVFLPSAVSWVLVLVAGIVFVTPLLLWALVPALICLFLGWAMRSKRSWMGGGDLKMLGGCLVLSGLSGTPDFVVWLSICNVLLVIWLRVARKLRPVMHDWERRRVPMGVSIAAAMALHWAFAHLGVDFLLRPTG